MVSRSNSWHMRNLYMYWHGWGDALLLNTVLYHLGEKTRSKSWVGTNKREIYRGNPHVGTLPFTHPDVLIQFGRLLKAVRAVRSVEYVGYADKCPPSKHLMGLFADRVGLDFIPDKPLLFISQKEKRSVPLPLSRKPWVAIQSDGYSQWTTNKNWGSSKFEAVARALAQRYSLVQLGVASDPALSVDLNLCGKVSAREAAVVLGSCKRFIGQEGYLMHAAAAVEVPSVIIYGGFIAPWQSGYPQNVNLYNPVPCAPCWLTTPCPNARVCLEEITVNNVLEAVDRLMPI